MTKKNTKPKENQGWLDEESVVKHDAEMEVFGKTGKGRRIHFIYKTNRQLLSACLKVMQEHDIMTVDDLLSLLRTGVKSPKVEEEG